MILSRNGLWLISVAANRHLKEWLSVLSVFCAKVKYTHFSLLFSCLILYYFVGSLFKFSSSLLPSISLYMLRGDGFVKMSFSLCQRSSGNMLCQPWQKKTLLFFAWLMKTKNVHFLSFKSNLQHTVFWAKFNNTQHKTTRFKVQTEQLPLEFL